MTQEMVRALSDGQLVQVAEWIRAEQKARAERVKRETIAKIKELAGVAGVTVNIRGVRGRPKNENRNRVSGRQEPHGSRTMKNPR